jgi:hypothetical protein
MRRIVEFFQEWYTFPGSLLIGIPVGLAVVIAIIVGLGGLTLDFLFY